MILTTIDYIPNMKIDQSLGVVKGSSVRTKHLGKDIRAIGRTLIGGEMTYYAELLEESRKVATNKMIEKAQELGADAIINIRYQTAMVMQGASEVLAFGTAVRASNE